MAEETARGAAQEAATDEEDVAEEVAELADLAARDARRERLAKELLDSETRYASVLEAFETVDQLVAAAICAEGFGEGQDLDEDLDLYEGTADAALARHQPLVSPRMRCLFATMRQLAVLSRATALALQKSMREYGPDRVGAILVRFADATYLYEEYAGAHTCLQQEIARLGSHPEFVQIWRRAARLVANKGLALPAIFPAQDGATAAATSGFTSSFSFSSSSSSTFTTSSQLPTTLSSFLILPIQRIPRYEMLLEEMRREANAVESLEALSAHLGTGRKSYDWWAKEQRLVVEARDLFREIAGRMELAIRAADSRPFLLAASLPPPPSRPDLPKVQSTEINADASTEAKNDSFLVTKTMLANEYELLRDLILAEETWALARIKEASATDAMQVGANVADDQALLLLAQAVIHTRQVSGHFVRVLQRELVASTSIWDDICWLASLAHLHTSYAVAFVHAWRLVAPPLQSSKEAIPSWLRAHATLSRRLYGLGRSAGSKGGVLRSGLGAADFARLREPMQRVVKLEADFARLVMHPGPFRARRPDFAEACSFVQSVVLHAHRSLDNWFLSRLLTLQSPLVDPLQDTIVRVGILYVRKRAHLVCLCTDRIISGPLLHSNKGCLEPVPRDEVAIDLGSPDTRGNANSGKVVENVATTTQGSTSGMGKGGMGRRRGKAGTPGSGRFVQIYLRNVDRIVAESMSATVILEPNLLSLCAPDVSGSATDPESVLALWTVPVPPRGQTRTAIFEAWVHSLMRLQRQ